MDCDGDYPIGAIAILIPFDTDCAVIFGSWGAGPLSCVGLLCHQLKGGGVTIQIELLRATS